MFSFINKIFVTTVLMLGFAFSALANTKIPVFVSILPQKYVVEKIGGDYVRVEVMVLPGASPHTFEPKPRQMVSISRTRLYFSIGVEFENVWLNKLSKMNPNMRLVHTDEGITKISMASHDHHDEEQHDEDSHHDEKPHDEDSHHDEEHHDEDSHHDEEHHDENSHHDEEHHDEEGHAEGLDPHIWLSPSLVQHQAEIILKALQQVDPSHSNHYQSNYRRFIQEIDGLDQDLKQILGAKKGLRFIVFHPSWGYFAKDYGIEQIPIEVEGKAPKPAQLKELIEHAREENIRVVFAQPQFSRQSARVIAKEIQGEVILIDPLAENWMKNMQQVARQLNKALK